jgi:tRNA-specific 2-thiouridylase
MKIAVLLSGGVDSSVALRLLQREQHDVTAFYIKIWLQDEYSFLGDCPWEEDMEYASKVCRQADVPLQVIALQDEYWSKVVSYTITEIKAGRTPNPDIFCNSLIKFGEFYDKIAPEYEMVASGHYAAIEHSAAGVVLKKSLDPVKDQTYFLAYLNPRQLARAYFPLGGYDKSQIRALASEFDLPNKNRKDSQGICFLGQIKFRDFIKYHLGELPGDIIEFESGKKLGVHNGYYYFTIGQRSGIGLHGGPWYVVKKDIINNIIYISQKKSMLNAMKHRFFVDTINWISPSREIPSALQVKIRHGASFFQAKLARTAENAGIVTLEGSDKGIAVGQFAVFYDGEICLGGGIISEEP